MENVQFNRWNIRTPRSDGILPWPSGYARRGARALGPGFCGNSPESGIRGHRIDPTNPWRMSMRETLGMSGEYRDFDGFWFIFRFVKSELLMNCCFFGELRQETQSGGTSKVCEEYNLGLVKTQWCQPVASTVQSFNILINILMGWTTNHWLSILMVNQYRLVVSG